MTAEEVTRAVEMMYSEGSAAAHERCAVVLEQTIAYLKAHDKTCSAENLCIAMAQTFRNQAAKIRSEMR